MGGREVGNLHNKSGEVGDRRHDTLHHRPAKGATVHCIGLMHYRPNPVSLYDCPDLLQDQSLRVSKS